MWWGGELNRKLLSEFNLCSYRSSINPILCKAQIKIIIFERRRKKGCKAIANIFSYNADLDYVTLEKKTTMDKFLSTEYG
jgi:hypothetical protein